MDAFGLGLFVVSFLLYIPTKARLFIFLAGVGTGIGIGAVWAMLIVNSVLR